MWFKMEYYLVLVGPDEFEVMALSVNCMTDDREAFFNRYELWR